MSKYTDLITRQQLIRDADKSEDLFDGGSLTSDEETLIDESIRDATNDIERYLDRTVIVRKVDQGINRSKWRHDTGQADTKYVAWAREWPLVQVETSNVKRNRNLRKLERSSPTTEVVTYFAGYHREGQSLSDLQNELPNLSTLPDRLPGAIRRVALVLSLHYILRARSGNLGVGDTITQTVGPQQVQINTTRRFVDDQLHKLSQFRRMR